VTLHERVHLRALEQCMGSMEIRLMAANVQPKHNGNCNFSSQVVSDSALIRPSSSIIFFHHTHTVSFECDVNIDEINEHLRNTIYHPLTNALHAMLHSKPDDPIEFIAKHILKHNVNQPIMQSTCPDALHFLQRLRDEAEECEQLDKKRQLMEMMKAKAKCGCSLTSSLCTLSSS
jgi:Dpy-30 motif